MKRRPSWVISLGLLGCILGGCASRPSPLASDPALPSALERLLAASHLTWTDLAVPPILDGADPWRAGLVESLLRQPLGGVTLLDAVADALPEVSPSLEGSLQLLVPLLGFERPARTVIEPFGISPPEGVPADLREPLRILLAGIGKASEALSAAFGQLSPAERGFLARCLPLLRVPIAGEQEETLDWDEVGAARCLTLGERVRRGKLIEGALHLAQAVDRAVTLLGPLTKSGPARDGELLVDWQSPWGRVVVGSRGRNVYTDDAVLILDLGGDDIYRNRAGGAEDGIAVVVDFDGDDFYTASRNVTQGGARFGIGILYDLTGDDRYLAQGLAQGMGFFGIGILWDGAGRDRYVATEVAQGAGLFGVGVLLDQDGDDEYMARASTQGFGFVGGLGVLGDIRGNDAYLAPGGRPDFRQEGHFQSFAQGFGLGLRPLASGGIGLLVDSAGSDRYDADYFAQGAGYWFGLGAVVDRSGDDSYRATRYAQGAGIHFALGYLMDGAGSDRYTSWIVSQGVGHDLAFGLLLDQEGDDVYQASGQSQGFGNANGIGILTDAEGDDRYIGEGETVQGYGQREQTFESLGFLMDGGGHDIYSGPGRDDTLWRRGEIGIGLDGEGIGLGFTRPAPILPLPPAVPASPPSGYAVAPPPAEEFFGREGMEALVALREASRLGPRPEQEASRRAAKARLLAMGEKAVPLLLYTLRSADLTRVMVAMEVLEKMGKATVPVLIETFMQPIQPSRRRAASLLARIADPSTRFLLLEGLEDQDPGVRAAAARGLGRIGDLSPAGWSALAERARRDPSRNVRWEAVTALGGADSATVVPVLLDVLADRDFTVRLAAQRALLRLGGKSQEFLRQFLAESPRGGALDPIARTLAQATLDRLSGASEP